MGKSLEADAVVCARFSLKFTPEVLWGSVHGLLSLGIVTWWQVRELPLLAARSITDMPNLPPDDTAVNRELQRASCLRICFSGAIGCATCIDAKCEHLQASQLLYIYAQRLLVLYWHGYL